MTAELTPQEEQRYDRQLVIPQIGEEGQLALKDAGVLIIGCGGVGTSCALYLAAAGIGHIGLVDHDTVALSNLNRQIAYSEEQIGISKVTALQTRLIAINRDICVKAYETQFDISNADSVANPYPILIDGTDHLSVRYLINDLCVLTGKPFVHGAVQQFSGQAAVFDSSSGACYRCIYPEPLSHAIPREGILGPVAGVIGMVQAMQVIMLTLGIGTPLVSQMLLWDALNNRMNKIDLKKNPECVICSANSERAHSGNKTAEP